MNRERTLWLAIGLLISTAAGIALGAMTLSGFASSPSGDVAVSAPGGATGLLMVLGAAMLLGMEWVHSRRRPARAAPMSAAAVFKA